MRSEQARTLKRSDVIRNPDTGEECLVHEFNQSYVTVVELVYATNRAQWLVDGKQPERLADLEPRDKITSADSGRSYTVVRVNGEGQVLAVGVRRRRIQIVKLGPWVIVEKAGVRLVKQRA